MRIALDARKLHDFGIGTYIRNLVRELALLDPTTEYVLFARPADLAEVAATGTNVRAVAEKAGPYSIGEQWRLPLAARRAGADLFHAPHYVLPPLIPGPTVVTIHDCIHLRFPQNLPSRAAWVYAHTMIRVAARKASRILTVSEASKRDILHYTGVHPEKVVVIHNGLDARFATAPDDEALERVRTRFDLSHPFVLYVGNIKPHKNLERLIEAFALARAGGPDDLRLVVIGDEISKYPGCASRCIVIASTSTCGSSASSRRRHWWPSTGWPGPSCSRRCTRASACRRSRRWPISPRWSPPTCRRCPRWWATPPCWSIRTTATPIADGIRRVVSDEALRQQLIARGRLRVQEFSWRKAAARTLERLSRRAELTVMRVALVHDWLTGMRGGEKALEQIAALFPGADIFTLVHVPGSVSPALEAPSDPHRVHPAAALRRPRVSALPAALSGGDRTPRPDAGSTWW